MTADGKRPLRRDAAQNAERVLAAAVRAGLARGSQVPMAQVAADAGVGVGTLYRRYPNREALVAALQVRAYDLLLDVVERSDADAPTGLGAVTLFLERSFAIRDQLVLPLHGAPWRADDESAERRAALRRRLESIVGRGHADGSVRADVTAWTVVSFGALLAQPLTGGHEWEQNAADLRAVFLRGISG